VTEATSGNAYLKIENLWKAFGDFLALSDVSLEINEGEFVCFLGPSGCGKTTLLRAIAGLDLQTRGSVHQGGKDVSSLPPFERDFGIVFQSYALFPNLTIEKNIAFGLENAGRKKPEIDARVSELLDLVGLEEQRNKYPAQLSGGQQQRIALARAIATNPGLLLLDEPLSALDAKVRVHLRHEIKELQRKLRVTTVMVTHDQEEALSMADRIVVIHNGRVEQIGTPTEIYRHPSTLFVAGFIGDMNKFDGIVDGPEGITCGKMQLECALHAVPKGGRVVMAIRPEDVVPHGDAHGASGASGEVETHGNTLDVEVTEMEFLGSYWRCRLASASLGTGELIANFSMNAVRRLGLSEGKHMMVELPKNRVMVFDAAGA
jgi:iron(III) transport system ATP-binding protein